MVCEHCGQIGHTVWTCTAKFGIATPRGDEETRSEEGIDEEASGEATGEGDEAVSKETEEETEKETESAVPENEGAAQGNTQER